MTSLEGAAKIVLRTCMGLKRGESLLIVFDKNKKGIADALFNQSKKMTAESSLMEIPVVEVNSSEPPAYVAKEMLKYDVIVLLTTKSLTHTLARKNASERGARIASMPNILEETLKRAISTDYSKLKQRGEKIKREFEKGKKVKITTELGTSITMGIRRGKIDYGIYTEKTQYGNLPAGEFMMAPLEGTSNGVFVIDASFAGIKDVRIKEPIKITVKEGYAIKIEGGKEAEELSRLLKSLNDSNAYNIAELGIGTNDKAKICGNVLEDEKVLGTAHIALGNNLSLGGKVKAPAHLDGVFFKPTIYVDNKKIMENEEFSFHCK